MLYNRIQTVFAVGELLCRVLLPFAFRTRAGIKDVSCRL